MNEGRVYTVADLEEAERTWREGDSGRHSNPGRTARWNKQALERVSEIRAQLIERGIIDVDWRYDPGSSSK